MTSVNPDNTYNGYYVKHLTDLEDELKADYGRAKERAKEQTDELNEKYIEATKKNNERTEEVIGEIREDMQDKYARSRASDREELEKIKTSHYDRFGRDRSGEADANKQRLENAIRAGDSERESHRRQLAELEASHEKSTAELNKRATDRLENTLSAERNSAHQTTDQLHERSKTPISELNDEASKKYNALDRERLKEQNDSRRRTETVMTDAKRDMDNLQSHSDRATEQRLTKMAESTKQRIDDNAKQLRESNDGQTHELRAQLRDLLSAENNYVKERGQGKLDAIREYEDENRAQSRRVDEAHAQEIKKFQAQAEATDAHHAQNTESNLHERDAYFTNLLAKKAAESREEQQTISQRYESAFKEAEHRSRKERQYGQERIEQVAHNASEERAEALQNQALVYQKNIATQRELDRDTVSVLQKELDRKNAPTEDIDISPAVENVVRRSLVKQYEKNHNAEIERNKRANESIHRTYSEKFQTAEQEHKNQLAMQNNLHQNEAHQAEIRFVEHIADTQANKDQSLRTAHEDNEREIETMARSYSQSTLRQRNDYDLIIQNLRDDASSRINTARQEAEFAMKTQQRASSARENELIRGYEKKLADQKTEYETRLDDVKIESAQKLRETERRDKQTYDDQGRGYEQRITQLEEQHKERERIVTQNFEEQLDKVKRSNALQQSKKG
jgi:hypothetical protein